MVDVWDHPNIYKLKLDAKPGMLYTLEITARADAAAAGMAFGMVGMLAEAAANQEWRCLPDPRGRCNTD